MPSKSSGPHVTVFFLILGDRVLVNGTGMWTWRRAEMRRLLGASWRGRNGPRRQSAFCQPSCKSRATAGKLVLALLRRQQSAQRLWNIRRCCQHHQRVDRQRQERRWKQRARGQPGLQRRQRHQRLRLQPRRHAWHLSSLMQSAQEAATKVS